MVLVKKIERCGSRAGTPTRKVTIMKCGILDGETNAVAANKTTSSLSTSDGLFGNTLKDAGKDASALSQLGEDTKPWYYALCPWPRK